MRHLHLLLLGSTLLNLSLQPFAAASPNTSANQTRTATPDRLAQVESSSESQEFWSQAQELTQRHMFLVNRIERAIAGTDPNAVRATRGQLTVYTAAVNRFLVRQYSIPQLLCNPGTAAAEERFSAAVSNLSPAQAQAYCGLYAANQQLTPLEPLVRRRLILLGGLGDIRPLPLVSGERRADPILGITSLERPRLYQSTPATPLWAPEANLPQTTAPLLVDREAKLPIANYEVPVQPAIAPPEEIMRVLQSAKRSLAEARAAFPSSAAFVDPDQADQIADRNAYDLYPDEPERFASFLAQPNTGIVRILPAAAYARPVNTLQNRAALTVAERFPFAPLLTQPEESAQTSALGSARPNRFVPRLAVQIVGSNFQLAQPHLDYGFMADLGNVPLETLTIRRGSPIPDFFLTYQPPNQLADLQTDQRLFFTGKADVLGLDKPLSNQAPIVVGHTYVLRSLQFALPEVITTNRVISPRERYLLDRLLETQSSDLLIAFQPVDRRLDGSYTVLWRVLEQFPDPQILDLDDYVRF